MQPSEDKRAQSRQAAGLIREGDFNQAIALLSTWLKDDPEDLDFYDLIGRAYRNRGDDHNVIPIYAQATRDFPNLGLQRSPNFGQMQQSGLERGLPPIFINTQFKSGSVFLRGALEKGLDIPFIFLNPQGVSPILVDSWLEDFARGGAVCQHHRPVEQVLFSKLAAFGIDKIWLHLRDPRQTTLSAIHHYSRVLVEGPPSAKDEMQRHLPKGYLDWAMAKKIDHYLGRHKDIASFPHASEAASEAGGESHIAAKRDPLQSFRKQVLWIDEWLDRAANELDEDLEVRVIDFTDMKAGIGDYLRKLLDFFEIDESQFDFSTLQERPEPGQAHFRKGETDEWRRVFSPAQIELANSLMTPRLLERYGP